MTGRLYLYFWYICIFPRRLDRREAGSLVRSSQSRLIHGGRTTRPDIGNRDPGPFLRKHEHGPRCGLVMIGNRAFG